MSNVVESDGSQSPGPYNVPGQQVEQPAQAPPQPPTPPPKANELFQVLGFAALPTGFLLRFVDAGGLVPLALAAFSAVSLFAAIVAPIGFHGVFDSFREARFQRQTLNVMTLSYPLPEIANGNPAETARGYLATAPAAAATAAESFVPECQNVAAQRAMLLPANRALLANQALSTCSWGCACENNTDTRPGCEALLTATRQQITNDITACTAAAAAIRPLAAQWLAQYDQNMTVVRARNDAPKQPWMLLLALFGGGIVAFQVCFYRLLEMRGATLRAASQIRWVVYGVRSLIEAHILGASAVVIGLMFQFIVTSEQEVREVLPLGTFTFGKLVTIGGSMMVSFVVLHVTASIIASVGEALSELGAAVKSFADRPRK